MPATAERHWPRPSQGCTSYFYGHIADGNMHIISLVPGAAVQPFDAMDEIVYGLVRRHGGTVSAEHGIGLKKKPYLSYARSEPELALMRRLKAALDPGTSSIQARSFEARDRTASSEIVRSLGQRRSAYSLATGAGYCSYQNVSGR